MYISNLLIDTYPELGEDGWTKEFDGGSGRVFRVTNNWWELTGQKITNITCQIWELLRLGRRDLPKRYCKEGAGQGPLIREVGLTLITRDRLRKAQKTGDIPSWIHTVGLWAFPWEKLKNLWSDTLLTWKIPKEVFPGISLGDYCKSVPERLENRAEGMCRQFAAEVHNILLSIGIFPTDIRWNRGNILIDDEAWISLDDMGGVYDWNHIRWRVCVNHDTTDWEIMWKWGNFVTELALSLFSKSAYNWIQSQNSETASS